jgi:hypothetical protein
MKHTHTHTHTHTRTLISEREIQGISWNDDGEQSVFMIFFFFMNGIKILWSRK